MDLHKAFIMEHISRLFNFFDDVAFNGRLSKSNIQIEFSNEIETDAGQSIRYADTGRLQILLSTHYLTNFERLCSTLLHEMCHMAQWVINQNWVFGFEAHNLFWYWWVAKCSSFFPQITVESTHNWD